MNTPEWITSLHPLVCRSKSFAPDLTVWHADVSFVRWYPEPSESKPPWKETYGKTLIQAKDGNWTVAEIELVRRLRKAGWEAGWLDTYGHAPEAWREWLLNRNLLPSSLGDFLNETKSMTGRRGGTPDVVAWRDNSLSEAAFIEYKGPNDSVKQKQIDWVMAALKVGMSIQQYAVVSWPKARPHG